MLLQLALLYSFYGLAWWLSNKESPANSGDMGSIPGPGRSAGEGNGNPLQYSCLANSVDTGSWQATVHRVTKSRIRLSDLSAHSWFTMCVCVC